MTERAAPHAAIYVDGDACPVKEEVYRVARRHQAPVFVVANTFLRLPAEPLFKAIVVDSGPDAADDWIAGRVGPRDVVITSDIPLADRSLKAGAAALHPTGKAFDRDSIGSALAQRAIMEQLRAGGDVVGGPRAFTPADRSRFLSALDAMLHKAKRMP